ncbi:putative ABC transporter, P-loop containing nucleoside triphosphate hydrolase [Rosa chinensis]|uniref:Putative ABC transporter, P-loop containing nucleoside triphosphate hydrolase n=1 Tax=Rosa chinensis TaxID=74649 RepID=A0A2P6S4W7_ROSCH|nr:putative ABC transporter, P-loop containing nucleoside triphosphate hydrolase [Rosa chinensis]
MDLAAEIGRSVRTSFREHASSFRSTADVRSIKKNEDDEVELQWAAIERLPTFERIRTSLFDCSKDEKEDEASNKSKMAQIDVSKLGSMERHVVIQKLIKEIEGDNHRLLQKLRERIDRVGLQLPTVEVRYQNLLVEAEYEVVQGKPLPTLWNTVKSLFSIVGCKPQAYKLEILRDISGIIKPSRLEFTKMRLIKSVFSICLTRVYGVAFTYCLTGLNLYRMTLLLGPPGCGKSTLLQALAGKLNHSLKVRGNVTYNGYKLNEFVPQKTSAYISQYDLHISEMTVREALDFAARCQGIGSRAGALFSSHLMAIVIFHKTRFNLEAVATTDIMKEVTRREKQEGIVPDSDIDTYMKILGLDMCAETIVGDPMQRGISGGQKKRLTTGEMMIGPARAFFMDEISDGQSLLNGGGNPCGDLPHEECMGWNIQRR